MDWLNVESEVNKLADKLDNINELRRLKYSMYGNKPPLKYLDQAEKTLEACHKANDRLTQALTEEIKLAHNTFR